jgi:N-acetylmuramoyl-L-alanine amidase
MKRIIIFGTAHLDSTPGKCSPDGAFREAVYSREIVADLKAIMEKTYGYTCFVDYESMQPLPAWTEARKRKGYSAEQSAELVYRTQQVNKICQKYGVENCLYVSIHVNGAGDDGKWHGAGGWGCYTSRGKTKADLLAECFYDAAITNLRSYVSIIDEGKRRGDYTEKQVPFRMDKTDGDRDLEADLYVLRHSACPAVLTENLFQDNRRDVAFLLSDEGRQAITRLHVEALLSYCQKY